jgi:hypothetical protein
MVMRSWPRWTSCYGRRRRRKNKKEEEASLLFHVTSDLPTILSLPFSPPGCFQLDY